MDRECTLAIRSWHPSGQFELYVQGPGGKVESTLLFSGLDVQQQQMTNDVGGEKTLTLNQIRTMEIGFPGDRRVKFDCAAPQVEGRLALLLAQWLSQQYDLNSLPYFNGSASAVIEQVEAYSIDGVSASVVKRHAVALKDYGKYKLVCQSNTTAPSEIKHASLTAILFGAIRITKAFLEDTKLNCWDYDTIRLLPVHSRDRFDYFYRVQTTATQSQQPSENKSSGNRFTQTDKLLS